MRKLKHVISLGNMNKVIAMELHQEDMLYVFAESAQEE